MDTITTPQRRNEPFFDGTTDAYVNFQPYVYLTREVRGPQAEKSKHSTRYIEM